MKFEIKKEDNTWRLNEVLEIWSLYAKSGFYKTFLFCTIIYPIAVLISQKTKRIRKEKNRILGEEVKKYIKIKYDLKFKYLSGPFALGALLEIFVRNFYDFFKITKSDVVYDIGATTGEYALKCAKEGARVFAFELEKEPYDAMKKHVKLNGFENQMFPFNCRIDGKKNSIDSFVRKTKKGPTLIKMDIEGDEEKALNGAKKTLGRYKPRIILETHSAELEKNCMDLLRTKGYKIVNYEEVNWRTKLFFLVCQ
jgi:predicted RNA methylase